MQSWLGVFKDKEKAKKIVNIDQLRDIVSKDNFSCIGSSHSYNGIQLYKGKPIDFRNSLLNQITYDEATHQVTVEPSVTVRQLKEFLNTKNRQLYNSGNYMDQTVIGAMLTGTHGYGDNAVMAESVESLVILDEDGIELTFINLKADNEFKYIALSFGVIQPIIRMEIATKPISQYSISSCLCSLSEIKFGGNIAFAVFPYSGDDPIAAITECKELSEYQEPTPRPKDWGFLESVKGALIKYYWFVDKYIPVMRKVVQQGIALMRGKIQRDIITDPHDIDYLYDPHPLVEHDVSPILSRKIMKPTETSYNVAFFCPQEITKEVIAYIIDQGNKIKPNGFRNFIGVRNINNKSDLPFAGNYEGKVSAIDLYSNPGDASFLWEIQRLVFEQFNGIRPHWGKSHLQPYIFDQFKDYYKRLLEIKESYCSDKTLLHPDLMDWR